METICIDNKGKIYKETLEKNKNTSIEKIFLYSLSSIDTFMEEYDGDISDITKGQLSSVITITDINGSNITVNKNIDNNISVPINVFISFKAAAFLGLSFGVDMIACVAIFEDKNNISF